jgi:hypothetical protein
VFRIDIQFGSLLFGGSIFDGEVIEMKSALIFLKFSLGCVN